MRGNTCNGGKIEQNLILISPIMGAAEMRWKKKRILLMFKSGDG